ncbi:Helicase associated domain protein [Candidatus Thioglobus sp.]|nr:Helicase associated domain protein [Candidatus Thioglobus sp.]
MASFDTFLNSFDPDKKGIQFEHFVKWFLKNDPEWLTQVDEVWLWNDYPNRWGPDCGIDLVFKHKNGDIWAVQAKCYDTNNTISKADIDTFLSESNRKEIDKRLLIASTDKLSKNARQVCLAQEKPVVLFLHADFDKAAIEYPSNLANLKSAKSKELPKPRPHQENAINDVLAGFKEDVCGQLIMACGTGKTFTSLWIKEELNAQTTLVLLPSLSLLSQTLREWTFAAKNQFEALCVCSDATVGNVGDDESIGSILDVAFPTTSNIQEIRSFLKRDSYKVIFSTYHSSPLIAEAQSKSSAYDFDLVFADEAHRCTGEIGNAFTTVLDKNLIKAKKKLFATATPRIYASNMKKRASEAGVEISDMSDENLFGRVFHNLSFAEAIDKKLLSDYQVVVIGVDEPMVSEWIQNREILTTDSGHKTDAKTLASQIGLIKAIKDFDLKKTISFHSRVKGAKDFAENLQNSMSVISDNNRPDGEIHTDFVSGQMSSYERALKLSQLKNLPDSEIGVLTNARCLSEGVDVPSLDGVAFIDPRNSQVDIIQAVGRAIRKSDRKKYGTIVLPVFIENEEEAEESIQKSNFKPIWGVINALKSHDENLSLELSQLRTNLGRQEFRGGSSDELPVKVIFDLPKNINESFSKSLRTIIIERTTPSWDFYYGLLLDYFDEHGDTNVLHNHKTEDGHNLGSWVHAQRSQKKINELSTERIQKLNDLKLIWDRREYKWDKGYEYLREFLRENNIDEINHETKCKNDYPLGRWVSKNRVQKNRNKLKSERIQKLDDLSFIWDSPEYQWNLGFKHFKQYIQEFGNSLVPNRYKTNDGYKLGTWARIQRVGNRDNIITPENFQKLNALGFIWSVGEFEWNLGYEHLKQYVKENDDALVPSGHMIDDFNLFSWVYNQRKRKSEKRISDIEIKKLDDLDFAWENDKEREWNMGFEYLKQYIKENGNSFVPSDFKINNFNLYSWSMHQRRTKENIPVERVNRLNQINFNWNKSPKADEDWNKGYELLMQYIKENGDSFVPRKYKIDGYPLGGWVGYQKVSKKNNTLTPEKELKLNEIGLVWDVLDYKWDIALEYFKKYIEENKSVLVPKRCICDEFKLGQWVSQQRRDKIDKRITAERIKILDDLGFVWKT